MEPLGLYGLLEGIRVSSSTLQSGAGRSSQSICSRTPSDFASLTWKSSRNDEPTCVEAPEIERQVGICSTTATETMISGRRATSQIVREKRDGLEPRAHIPQVKSPR